MLSHFPCGRPGEEDAGRYRGRGYRVVGGHQFGYLTRVSKG
ncbi:hypothetical protein BN903_140 [Halorubrum sp. AJ67]|nr:hypothetical protein BN903_140 [Halorubrum sp. AJ67]